MIVWDETTRKWMRKTRKAFQGEKFRVIQGTGHTLTTMTNTLEEANFKDNNPAVLLTTFIQQKTLNFKNRVKSKIRERRLTFYAFDIQLKGILES